MKPSFALDLRDDQVSLLHRTSRGWMQIGATRFDAPDLTEALAYMRSTALGLSPRGISTKLIIPNDQILYAQVAAPGPDAAKRRRQIKAGLEGMTPYALDDLVYDWHGSGPEVQVAVVARETLEQAEAFAAEHRFNPVSFVAVPDNGQYLSEPFFGASKMSPALLSDGEKVEHDAEPVNVVTRDLPRPVEKPVVVEEVAAPPEPEPVAPAVAEVEPEPVIEPVAVVPAVQEVADEAPMALDVPDEAPAPAMDLPTPEAVMRPGAAAIKPEPEIVDDIPAAPAEALRAALAAQVARSAEADLARPAVGAAPTASAPRPAMAKPVGAIDTSALRPGTTPAKSAARPSAPGKALKGVSAMVTAPAIPGMGRRKPIVSTPAAATPPRPATPPPATARSGTGTVGKPMTDLKGKPLPVRGKPRYLGLILTGVLLVFLVLAAAWSSFFLAGLTSDQTPPAATELSQAATPDAAATDAPTAADEAAADGQDLAATDPAATDTATASAAPSPDATTAPDEAATQAAAEAAAAAEVPAPAPDTGAASVAAIAPTAGTTTSDEIFLAAIEPATRLSDPVTLATAPSAGDAAPLAGPEPPPFGTVYQFDAEGRIVPTPEGIITPEGVLLVAGKPSVVPPDRPATIAALAAPVVEPAAEAVTAPAAEAAPVVSDPALQGFKPKARPATLVPAAVTAEPAALPDTRLAGFKPRARSSSALAPVLAAVEPEPQNSASTAGLDGPAVTANADGSLLVVSRVPVARPAALTQGVEAAVVAALEPEPAAAPDPAASAAPEAQAEPEVENPAPSIPTNASVAKTATDKDALNLSKLALIGVFGPDNGRYAYVRLANGSLKKVKIGDQLDGGKVVAISTSELRYQQGAKLLVLAMPREG